MRIEAIIFDCDGLMFDTEYMTQKMWEEEAEKAGAELPDDFFVMITGSSGRKEREYLLSIPGLQKAVEVMAEKRFDLDFWASQGTDSLNKKGLIRLFTYLKDRGYPVAICSSSGKKYVETLVSTVSVPLQYEAVIGGDMVRYAKPDPEIFLLGAQALGIKPENCLVLEDSKQGILAARAAGMHSCFIQDTIIPDEEMEAAIEFRADSLLDVIDLLENTDGGTES